MTRSLPLVLCGAVAIVLASLGQPVLAQDDVQTPSTKLEAQPGTVVGLGFPTVGQVNYGDSGYAQSFTGGNLLLGYSSRNYTDGLRSGQFNFYWGWGTFALILPYFEAGYTYATPIADGTQLLTVDIGVIYIVPRISVSVVF